jgi:hypothetical protein
MISRRSRSAGNEGVGARSPKNRGPRTEDRARWFNAEGFLSGLRRVNVFCGGFGSGKTEVAVNFCVRLSELGRRVSIADLDIVNLYFRSREVREQLRGQGIEVIVPGGALVNADLPIIVPEVRGALEDRGSDDALSDRGRGGQGRGTNDDGTTPVVVLDLGGDPAGAKVMASLAEAMRPEDYSGLFVLNSRRPFTATVSAAEAMMVDISEAARINVDRIVVNSHLIDETTPEVIGEGIALGEALAQRTGAHIAFVAVQRVLLDRFDAAGCRYPVMVLDRLMLKPWEPSNWLGKYRIET